MNSLSVQDIILAQILFWATVAMPMGTAFFWKWWQNNWGRNIISLDLSLAIVFFPSIMSLEFNVHADENFRWALIATIGLYLVVVNTFWRAFLIIFTQITGAKKRRDAKLQESQELVAEPSELPEGSLSISWQAPLSVRVLGCHASLSRGGARLFSACAEGPQA